MRSRTAVNAQRCAAIVTAQGPGVGYARSHLEGTQRVGAPMSTSPDVDDLYFLHILDQAEACLEDINKALRLIQRRGLLPDDSDLAATLVLTALVQRQLVQIATQARVVTPS